MAVFQVFTTKSNSVIESTKKTEQIASGDATCKPIYKSMLISHSNVIFSRLITEEIEITKERS